MGVSAGSIDWTMVPYVRKSFRKHMVDGLKYIEGIHDEEYLNSIPVELRFDDPEANDARHSAAYQYAMDMTQRELEQAVEGMYHNLNSLQSRSGNQLPFSSINFGSCTLPEGRMVIKTILEGSIKGVGKFHKTSIFPCSIFQVGAGINKYPGDPNYDLYRLALKSTSKRLYPNYANLDWTVQRQWVDYDRNMKEKVISELSIDNYNKLRDNLKNKPDLQEKLSLIVSHEGRILVNREKVLPFEIMGTMGK